MKLSDESPNKAIITTKFVVKNKSTITYVSCDEDGDWQFHSYEDATEEDIMVLSVEQILKIDTSLLAIPDLQKSQSVNRENINSEWILND